MLVNLRYSGEYAQKGKEKNFRNLQWVTINNHKLNIGLITEIIFYKLKKITFVNGSNK